MSKLHHQRATKIWLNKISNIHWIVHLQVSTLSNQANTTKKNLIKYLTLSNHS